VSEAYRKFVKKLNFFIINILNNFIINGSILMDEKNDFEVSKNLARYKSENNFVSLSKLFCRALKHNEQCRKKIWHSSNQFERPT